MNSQLNQFPELTVFPSQANFLLVKLPGSVDGAELCDYLLAEHHLLVRQCGNKIGMTSQFMRFGVRPDTEVERLVEGLRGVERLGGGGRHTPTIELVAHSREPERSIS